VKRREKRRRVAAAIQAPAVRKTGGRRLGHYEALLLDNGDAEVVASLEALLQAVAARLARKPRGRSNGRKR